MLSVFHLNPHSLNTLHDDFPYSKWGADETGLFDTDTALMETQHNSSPPHHFAGLEQARQEDALK